MTRRSTCALARSVREPTAFAGFYEAEAPRLLIFFARRTCDPHAALDLCAETFAEAFAGRRRFRGYDGEFFAGSITVTAHFTDGTTHRTTMPIG